MTKAARSLVTRRNVVAMSVGAAATGAFAASFSFTSAKFTAPSTLSWWQRPVVDLATAGSNDWSSQVGSVFTLVSERGNLNVKLAKVTLFPSAGARPRGLRDSAFALTFDLIGGALPAGDRMYTLSHAGEDLKVFFGAADKGLLAVFN